MKTIRILSVAFVCVGFLVSGGWAANIVWFGSGANADAGLEARLSAAGHTVTQVDPSTLNGAGQMALAAANNLVIISETIGSTAVSTAGVFNLMNSTTPIISFEAFMWDEAKWTSPTQFVEFGNTRADQAAVPLALASNAWDTLYITNPGHMAAGGLPAGPVVVYNTPFSVAYGTPTGDAAVIATADAAGLYPSIFAYDAGDMLVDGSMAPALRMSMYFGQGPALGGIWTADIITADGLTLFDAAVNYALIPEPVTLALLGLGGLALLRRKK